MAFWYGVLLHFQMNIRNKEILVQYYIVPLVFYLFVGTVFTSIIPDAYKTLIQAMMVFGVTMGGVLGSPYPLAEIFGSEIKKAYQVGNIPFWSVVLSNLLSTILHLLLMSLLIFVSAPTLFDALMPLNMVSFILGLILLIVASASIGMVFGLFVRNLSKLGMITQVVFLPSIMLSGIMFSTNLLPTFLKNIGLFLPATWGFVSMCEETFMFYQFLPLILVIVGCLLLSGWKLMKLYSE